MLPCFPAVGLGFFFLGGGFDRVGIFGFARGVAFFLILLSGSGGLVGREIWTLGYLMVGAIEDFAEGGSLRAVGCN